jgi:hypothetical protein
MKADDRVFDDTERADSSPGRHSEATAHFLKRVSGEYWDQIRCLIDEWVSHVPAHSRADLIGRLRSNDNRQFAGAFWELYLHETLLTSGFAVTIHPTVAGSARQPDFLVTGEDSSFYLEAKALVGKDPDPGSAARTQRLYDALDQIDSPNFFLAIDVNAVGATDLPTRALRTKLEQWLGALDPDTTTFSARHDDNGETFPWQRDGWELSFRPIPIKPAARGKPDHRVLGLFGPIQAAWVSDDAALKAALFDKGTAYGDLDQPLVIAVNCFGFSHDDFDTMNALYGTSQIRISMDDPDAPPVPVRAPDGYWIAGSWAHQHVAGVLIGRSVGPWRVTEEVPTFWPHPEPARAVSPLDVWRVAQPVTNHIEYIEPKVPIHGVLGLPAIWPIGEPWPKEIQA